MENLDWALIGLQLFIALTALSKRLDSVSINHLSIKYLPINYFSGTDKPISLSIILLSITLIYASLTFFISLTGLTWLVLLAFFSGIAARHENKVLKNSCYLLTVSLFLILGFKLLPGFESPLLIENQILKAGSSSYHKTLGIDKVLAGLVVFVIFIPAKGNLKWNKIPSVLGLSLATAFLVLSFGWSTALIKLSFNDPFNWSFILYFIFIQVFFVALIEETFFRGLIQEKLYQIFKPYSYYYNLIPLSVTATLFGLVHLGGGWIYACLSMLAGLGYGVVYQNTRRVEVSVFAHTLLNTLHLLCFTYPLAT